MNARFLYFVTDCDSPSFPLSAVANFFRVVAVDPHFTDSDWFNWEAAGCVVLELRDPESSFAILNRIRNCWISVPAVLQTTQSGWYPPRLQQFAFSTIVSPATDFRQLANMIESLLQQDLAGQPSPRELRQRFGRLGCQERRVLQLALHGQTSREIAGELNLRSQTVDKYKRRALVRMQTKNLLVLLRHLHNSISKQLVFPPT